MNNAFFQLKSFFKYWLDNVDEHSLHSPFFFKFYTNLLNAKEHSEPANRLEGYRKKLLTDDRSIYLDDLGSGSTFFKSNAPRLIRDIARTSVTPRKYSDLYFRLIKENNYKTIIELGTSIGINTLYLGLAPNSHVTTFEGAENVARVAEEFFHSAGFQNIKLVKGDIDVTLPEAMKTIDALDFALIDANHRYEPTLKYFDILASKVTSSGIIVLDDIHSSTEMERAWNIVREDARVWGTADLYRCGLVFFEPSLNKQHVVLRF